MFNTMDLCLKTLAPLEFTCKSHQENHVFRVFLAPLNNYHWLSKKRKTNEQMD